MGEVEVWNHAESALKSALEVNNLKFKVNEKDGAFYGPKIDVHIQDALNRNWQMATVQLDFNLPERFDLNYEGSDGKKHRPVMIHRAIYGSYERFMGILTEHFAGNFPLWLSPVQIAVLPIKDSVNEYSEKIYNELLENGFRVFLDNRNEKINYKIREAENRKIPYMIVIGEKEMQEQKISARQHKKGDIGKFELKEFAEKIKLEIVNKVF
jgi:threonyl-tRNA synthetase